MILSAAGFVVFSAKYFWWSNVRSVFLAMSVQALTLKSESGILRSWCVCWSAAQTLSPGGHEGRFKMQLDKFHPKDRLHMFDDCLLTWTATPKLFPSSILGIWSCTHIDTFQENKKKKNPLVQYTRLFITLIFSAHKTRRIFLHIKFWDWPCWASPSVSGSQFWPSAGGSPPSHWCRWDHMEGLEDRG